MSVPKQENLRWQIPPAQNGPLERFLKTLLTEIHFSIAVNRVATDHSATIVHNLKDVTQFSEIIHLHA